MLETTLTSASTDRGVVGGGWGLRGRGYVQKVQQVPPEQIPLRLGWLYDHLLGRGSIGRLFLCGLGRRSVGGRGRGEGISRNIVQSQTANARKKGTTLMRKTLHPKRFPLVSLTVLLLAAESSSSRGPCPPQRQRVACGRRTPMWQYDR